MSFSKSIVIIISVSTLLFIVAVMLAYPQYRVYSQTLEGTATLQRAEQERQILIEQARAELEAAELRKQAIQIIGQAAKDFPEYREQEFIGAFGEAMREGNIEQIMYVPTERNIPIVRVQ